MPIDMLGGEEGGGARKWVYALTDSQKELRQTGRWVQLVDGNSVTAEIRGELIQEDIVGFHEEALRLAEDFPQWIDLLGAPLHRK